MLLLCNTKKHFYGSFMSEIFNEIPGRIKRLREEAKFSQSDLARMTNLTQAQISAYEVGRSLPGLESAVALSAALGTTVAELIGQASPRVAPPRPATKSEMACWLLEAIGIDGFPLERCRQVLIDKVYKT
jgi:transcriptional regulator with XRE-family HTH domain